MSKLAMSAVEATVIFAVTWFELTNAVELTVIPPGSVVPVKKNLELAPFLNPLPPTATFRLMVPCAAEFGFAEVTCGCAANGTEPTAAANNSERTAQRFSIYLPLCASYTGIDQHFPTQVCILLAPAWYNE